MCWLLIFIIIGLIIYVFVLRNDRKHDDRAISSLTDQNQVLFSSVTTAKGIGDSLMRDRIARGEAAMKLRDLPTSQTSQTDRTMNL
jgi:hypothetical protein